MISLQSHRFVSIKCKCCGYVYDAMLSCGDRLCPLCAERRYGVLVNRYKDFFRDFPPGRCRFVTLTLVNQDDLGKMFSKLQRCVHRLVAYGKKHWGWRGGVTAFQVTNKGKGWHCHSHLIVDGGDFVPQEKLSKVWFSITGDSYVVGIRLVLDPIRDLGYLVGYALETDVVLPEFHDVYNELMRGRRLLQSWGSWFNRISGEVDKVFLCPSCGAVDEWVSSFSLDFFTVGARPLFNPLGSSP